MNDGRAKLVSPSQPNHQIVALDLLRGLAALIVFLGHGRGFSFVDYGALPASQHSVIVMTAFAVSRLSHEAVLVFFVLSGFLVGGQIVRRVRESRFEIGVYTIDRSTRILLPLIPACTLAAIVSWLTQGAAPGLMQVILNMFGLNRVVVYTLTSNPPLWTLSYEIWFYVFGGSAAYLVSARKPNIVGLCGLLCSIWVFTILDARYLLYWGMGALASFSLLRSDSKWTLLAVGTFLALGGSACYEFGSASKSFQTISFASQYVSEFLICAGICMMIPALCDLAVNRRLARIRKLSAGLSAISYSLYLFHYPLYVALQTMFPQAHVITWSSLALFGVEVGLVFAAVLVLYILFERNTPALRIYLTRTLLSETKQS